VLLFAFTPAYSIEWKAANQVTVQWDAPTTLVDGSPIPAGAIIMYEVYLANAVTDPGKTNPTNLTPNAPISDLSMVITLAVEGKFYVGVKAVRVENNETLSVSEINWSDANGAATPNPFGLVHYLAPAAPGNLR
jgi:hypothetical protein